MAAIEAFRDEDALCAVYLFDLDDLKRIHDTQGHGKGDEALCRFGSFLSSHARETDVLARYGGDEFVVIMKNMKTAAAMKKIRHCIRRKQGIKEDAGCGKSRSTGMNAVFLTQLKGGV